MDHKFYQVCYGRPDTGWSVVNASENLPKSLMEDFAAIERGNAAMASGELVPMGQNETPSCMLELYCRNDVLGLARVQYQLSDIEGRPISFAHGYLFPDAYERLKTPNDILCIKKENFADQKISQDEKKALQERPGGLNRELMKRSAVAPETFARKEAYTLSGALDRCGMDARTYQTWLKTVYAQILTANTQKNLYVKTDGTEENALSLLYLTYLALPYSLRPVLSASTCLHKDQRNTRLLFCAVPPKGTPQIDPATGENNVLDDQLAERLERRYPVISSAVQYTLEGKQKNCFDVIEYLLVAMGNPRANGMRDINFAHSIYRMRVYEDPALKKNIQAFLHQWLSLPAENTNTEEWEFVAECLLDELKENHADVTPEIQTLLVPRTEAAIRKSFSEKAAQYLGSSDKEQKKDAGG